MGGGGGGRWRWLWRWRWRPIHLSSSSLRLSHSSSCTSKMRDESDAIASGSSADTSTSRCGSRIGRSSEASKASGSSWGRGGAGVRRRCRESYALGWRWWRLTSGASAAHSRTAARRGGVGLRPARWSETGRGWRSVPATTCGGARAAVSLQSGRAVETRRRHSHLQPSRAVWQGQERDQKAGPAGGSAPH